MEEKIWKIIDKIDNTLFMAEWPTSSAISPSIHLKWCIWTLKEIKQDLETSEEKDWSLDWTTEALVLAEIILKDAKKFAKKFIDKVDNWKARSVETYQDMKQLFNKIEKYEKDWNI